ncbi:MAG: aspartate aminotransferase family protein [Giesbergeria sp.]|uniref:pyridoxal phosphate-dependent decarboxylase family protein n=1 Tax=Giesbergeria sp. TaxID=2818473 RepID=UPI00260C8339|nr:aspartate aminotransferase family protein [Giesbergeria sp.]MDD2608528.1 aspartate aminotransferase family protein [Giesbergeria sp.]
MTHLSSTAALLHHDALGQAQLAEWVNVVLKTLATHVAELPYSGLTPAALQQQLACDLSAPQGLPAAEILARLGTVVAHCIRLDHPHTAAHLHCPPLAISVAAELVVAALNPSMDSFDQAPAATIVEMQLVRHLCDLIGLGPAATGTFTPGATQSNFMGLLLAREAFYQRQWSRSAWHQGLGQEAHSLRILCSEASHFSVEKSAAQLGLGTQSVVRVPCDGQFRLCTRALRASLAALQQQGLHAMAIVATAGTTDFGSIDPLAEVASIAQEMGVWLHVDAAYGGALIYSEQHQSKLLGIAQADSVSIDFHKLLWQPIACGAFLLKNAAHFDLMKMHVDYLNPQEHEQAGVPDLVTRSLLTTRRFDALKLWLSLQLLGRVRLGSMIDATLALAQAAAAWIKQQPQLALLHQPMLGCVVFRYVPRSSSADADSLNANIRQLFFDQGRAVLGQTRVHGQTCLKITCMNPDTTTAQLLQLLQAVVEQGLALESPEK